MSKHSELHSDKSIQQLPTLYDYYRSDGIKCGLSEEKNHFTLNNRDIIIFSGAIHYFRVPKEYWRDRLLKLRAAGFNTVETYVPWNLHEPEDGHFDFGDGHSDYQDFLAIKEFLEVAKQEDLLTIVRPGPYICAEWEFGGLPSWLLRNSAIKVRTSDELFVKYFRRYFEKLLEILAPLQFTKGGSIIAFQIENEYGNTKNSDLEYLEEIKNALRENGISELLFTSDTPSVGFSGTLPEVLVMANFDCGYDFEKELSILKKRQPNKPLMVMEYWTGWFDHWSEEHQTRNVEKVCEVYESILKLGASINIYMFHGGSNWGFLNGGNFLNEDTDNSGYIPTTSSYDYDAPLSENGDYTEKYFALKQMIEKYNTVKTKLPVVPELIKRACYPEIKISAQLSMQKIIKSLPSCISTKHLFSMEMLPVNNGSGQSYGYIIYRKQNVNFPPNSKIIIEGHVCDSVMVLINGDLKSSVLKSAEDLSKFGYWKLKDSSISLDNQEYSNATMELIVENWGRANFGKLEQFNQRKGIWQGNVLLNGNVIHDWQIYPLEFKSHWTNNLQNWEQPTFTTGPALYKAELQITEKNDTYIDMRRWCKGIVILNGFVLSRYLHLGPQQTIYVPAPFLKLGTNHLIIFEHFLPSKTICFSADPIFHTVL